MFSSFLLGYVSIQEIVEFLMKWKSHSPLDDYQWKKLAVSKHLAPCLLQSPVPSPHIALLCGRTGWTSRTWHSTGPLWLTFTGTVRQHYCFGRPSWPKYTSVHPPLDKIHTRCLFTCITGQNTPQVFVHLHQSHCMQLLRGTITLLTTCYSWSTGHSCLHWVKGSCEVPDSQSGSALAFHFPQMFW